jgi:hypothetical protein
MNVLYTNAKGNRNWDQMPFPKKWFDDLLMDKVGEPRGYLKIQAFDHKDEKVPGPGKLVYEFGMENQITYWLKQAFAMLEAGIYFRDAGEHKGLEDGGTGLLLDETDTEAVNWKYVQSGGQYIYSGHTWKSSTDALALTTDITLNTQLYPYFPTKMRFGTGGPVDVTTVIDPADIQLEDVNSQGAGNQAIPNLNYIIIDRPTHIALTTTGYSTTAPSGYYADYGAKFKNISVYQVTMPDSLVAYCYDGETLNEAGLYCDASLTGTTGGTHDMPYGMLLAKRYFSPITKSDTISVNFMWSVVK